MSILSTGAMEREEDVKACGIVQVPCAQSKHCKYISVTFISFTVHDNTRHICYLIYDVHHDILNKKYDGQEIKTTHPPMSAQSGTASRIYRRQRIHQ